MLAAVEELVRGKWGVVDGALWPQLFTVALWWRGNSAEITRGRWADRLRSIHFHHRNFRLHLQLYDYFYPFSLLRVTNLRM